MQDTTPVPQLTPNAVRYFPELGIIIEAANQVSTGEGSPELIPFLMCQVAQIIQIRINIEIAALFAA